VKSKIVYTVGHSTHDVQFFINMLKKNNISVIVDVRSTPFSKYADQFNKDILKFYLSNQNIAYIHMGNLLGARYTDAKLLFNDGKVNFSEVVKLNSFKIGIDRLEGGLNKGYTIALMCSEKNPLECHRFSMISNYLNKNDYKVFHILPDRVIDHNDLEDKLFNYYMTKNKITFDIDRILRMEDVQSDFLNNKTKDDMYYEINKLVGYDNNSDKDENDDC
jgi:uncharacterized protein (DUF488 family)